MTSSAALRGKTCLITGASSGIGLYTAEGIAAAGARTLLVCRNRERGEQAVERVRKKTGNDQVELLQADLASKSSIRALGAAVESRCKTLHVLINNAGVINMARRETPDGLEETFAVNHLAYYHLTLRLLDLLKRSAPARVVNVASTMHRFARLNFDDLENKKRYAGFRAYNESKLANVLFTRELARRLEGTGVTVNCAHPGGVASNFGTNNGRLAASVLRVAAPFLRTPEKGAETSVWLATAPEVEGVTGGYFTNCKQATPSRAARDEAAAKRLWEISARMTGVGA